MTTMNSQPFEMVSGPLTLYRAVAETSAPTLGSDPPSGVWTTIGRSGDQSYSEDGITVTPGQTLEKQRVLGSTGPRKVFRPEEELMLNVTILDMTVETFANAMNNATVSDKASVTGAVLSVSVTNGGSGYTGTPSVAISGSGGSGARATPIIEGEEVVRIEIEDAGSGYPSSGTTVAISGGSGTGALATATVGNRVGYRSIPLKRGFDVDIFAFLARGQSPYNADGKSQFWIPRAHVESVGEVSYVKNESAMFELEIAALDSNDFGFGQYQAQD